VFERTAPVRMGHVSQVHTFITDICPSEEIRRICAEHDVRLVETG
jgi:DeoR family glycerol-3-phosphate regulon repressor